MSLKGLEAFLESGCSWASIEIRFCHANEDGGGNYHLDFYSVELENDRGFSESLTCESLEEVLDFIRMNSGACPKCDHLSTSKYYNGPEGQVEQFCSRCDHDFLKRATDWNEVMD